MGDPPGPGALAADPSGPTASETDPIPRTSRQSRNAQVDIRGETRSNATHGATTGPEARLCKTSPGTGAVLCFLGNALMGNRSGLIVQGDLTRADGRGARRTAPDMIHRHSPGSTRRLTPGADKSFDAGGFDAELRQACVTAHVAQRSRPSAIDGRTPRHEGHARSQRHRNRIEDAFGWAKAVGGMAQTVHRGVEKVRARFILAMAANDLARRPRLLAAWRQGADRARISPAQIQSASDAAARAHGKPSRSRNRFSDLLETSVGSRARPPASDRAFVGALESASSKLRESADPPGTRPRHTDRVPFCRTPKSRGGEGYPH